MPFANILPALLTQTRPVSQIVITIAAADAPVNFTAALPDGTVPIEATRKLLLDAARVLIRRGLDSATIAVARHVGSDGPVAIRVPVGAAARLVARETEQRSKFKPLPPEQVGPRARLKPPPVAQTHFGHRPRLAARAGDAAAGGAP